MVNHDFRMVCIISILTRTKLKLVCLFFYQLRAMEEELEEERKTRQSAQSARRKLEGTVKDLEAQLENSNRIKEEGMLFYFLLRSCFFASSLFFTAVFFEAFF